MQKPSDIDLAYIAGFIDGEGSINICGSIPHVRISISNTNLPILQEIQSLIGGRLYSSERPGKPHWKQGHFLILTTRKAVLVLPWLIPFLRIKKPQALLALQFDAARPGYGHKWDPAERERWRDQFHDLNRRGSGRAKPAGE